MQEAAQKNYGVQISVFSNFAPVNSQAIGSSMVFGGWAVESALPLSWTPEGWVGEVRLPPGAYEFKAGHFMNIQHLARKQPP